MISNRNLPNSNYSSFDWNSALDKAKDTVTKVTDTVSSVKDKFGKPKDTAGTGSSTPAPTEMEPAKKSETLIFGMHPITIVIGTVGVLLLTGVSIYAYKQFKK